MNIEDRITEEILHITTSAAYEPKNIYLGELEFQELIDWIKESYGFYMYTVDRSLDCLEVMGLHLFVVKTKSHFNITG